MKIQIKGEVTEGQLLDFDGVECVSKNNVNGWSSPTLSGTFYVDDMGEVLLSNSFSYFVYSVCAWGYDSALKEERIADLEDIEYALVDVFEDGEFAGEFYIVAPYVFPGSADVFEDAGLCDDEWWEDDDEDE